MPMKKIIPLLIISTLILSGCGSKNKVQQPQPTQNSQQVQDDDDEEMSWFEDEVLDMDDWGESKRKKVKPKTDTSKSVKATTPSKPKTSTKPSVSKKKS